MDRRLKLVGALLLLASLTLPVSECTHYEASDGTPILVKEDEAPPAGARRVVTYCYVLQSFEPADVDSWSTLFAFIWPIVAVAVLWRKSGGLMSRGVRVLEPLMLGWSFYVVDFISSFLTSGRAIGAHVAFLALAGYATGALWSDIRLVRDWKKKRAAAGPSGSSP